MKNCIVLVLIFFLYTYARGYNNINDGLFDGDTVEIYAIRVEFQPDTVDNTTGNGLFMRATPYDHANAIGQVTMMRKDVKEFEWYFDGTYKYDNLPHDSLYFHEHLTALRDYFLYASWGKIRIGFKIFPDGAFGSYKMSREMALFSPGIKKKNETFDEFYLRASREFMKLVTEAVVSAKADKIFEGLKIDSKGYLYKEEYGRKVGVFVLLIFAGSSGLTDGGRSGSAAADSPNDITASFIEESMFRYFNSPQENIFNGAVGEIDGKMGIKISDGANITRLMTVNETANQDSLNWGIAGTLVNQFARHLGVPDLYSTTSGISGVGSFCIMDFAGYSSAQGFIPVYPSAFVRYLMGWQVPIPAKTSGKYPVRVYGHELDSTLYKIPLNTNEFLLIENRQRNLTGNPNLFSYDTIDGRRYIASGFEINLDENVKTASAMRRVISEVKSRDIGLGGSGVLVWHIDENLLNNRFGYNLINSDSSYRAVNLVEADGIKDIGVEFTDVLGFPWFDYGGAGDVFPHTNSFDGRATGNLRPMGNDGGRSLLNLHFENTNTKVAEIYRFAKAENTKFEDYTVTNFSDSLIRMTVNYDAEEGIRPVDGFPVKIRDGFDYFPLISDGENIIITDAGGRITKINSVGKIVLEDSVKAVSMASVINGEIKVPSNDYPGISTYIMGINKGYLYGRGDGTVKFSDGTEVGICNSPVNAVAMLGGDLIVAVTQKGTVGVFNKSGKISGITVSGLPPFKVITSDSTVVVADRKQGLWFMSYGNRKLSLKEDGPDYPIDWAGIFREESEREAIPDNFGYPSLADLEGNGEMRLLIGGTNGIYAFDMKGYLLAGYPKFLDRSDWMLRKSVISTPIAVRSKDETYIFFTTLTGHNKTYYATKATKVDTASGTVFFNDPDGLPDSIRGFSKGFIDTLVHQSDSVLLPYYAPGGLIDMRSLNFARPSQWTISIGNSLSQGVLIDDIGKTGILNLVAVSDNGTVYNYELSEKLFNSRQTNMVGVNAERIFSASAVSAGGEVKNKDLEYFYSYPNPVKISKGQRGSVIFRYKLGRSVSSVKISIYTVQGQKVFEAGDLPKSAGVNEFTLRDMSKFGSAPYNCRISVKMSDGKEHVLFWKMAVLR